MDESEQAFAATFRTHYAAVARFAERRVADREIAREITADVFRIAWTRLGEQQPRLPWLYAVAKNLIGDQYRRDARDRELWAQLVEDARSSTGPENSNEAVLTALTSLSEPSREVLQLAYWERLRAKEIGQVLGCSAGAARVRLHRARGEFATAYASRTTTGRRA